MFSITDILTLLNKICVHMIGEFEIRHTPSCYIQIAYKPYIVNEEVEFGEEYRVSALALQASVLHHII